MDTEELRVLIRTVADTAGATQTNAALRGVAQQSEQLNSSMRRTRQGTREAGEGFGQAAENVARFVGALTGVELGLSLFASAGEKIREVLRGAIEVQAENERTVRATAAAYGAAAGQFQNFAEALSQQTGFTKQSILEAALSARTLSQNYQLTIAQTQRLIAVSADLARVRGIGVAESFERVQSAIRGEAEASEFLGLTLNDTFLQQNAANGAYRTTFNTLSDAQKAQIRYTEVLRQSAQFSGLAAQAARSLDGAMGQANLAASNLSLTLGKLIEPSTITTLQAATTAALALQRALEELEKRRQLPAGQQVSFGDIAKGAVTAIPPLRDVANVMGVVGDAAEQMAQAERNRQVEIRNQAILTNQLLEQEADIRSQIASATLKPSVTSGFNEQLRQTHTTLQQIAADISALGTRGGNLSSVLGGLGETNLEGRAQVQTQQALQQIDARILANRALLAIEKEIASEREATKITDPRDVTGARAAQQRVNTLEQLLPLERARVDLENQRTALQQQSVQLSGQQAELELQLLPARQQLVALDRELNNAQTERLQLLRQQAELESRQRAAPALEALDDTRAQIERNRLLLRVRGATTPEERRDISRENRELRQNLRPQELAAFDAQRQLDLQNRAGAAADIQEQLRQNRIRQQQAAIRGDIAPAEAQLAALQSQLDRLGLIGRILDAAGQRLTLAIQVTVDGQVATSGDVPGAIAGQVANAVYSELVEANRQAQLPAIVQQSGVRRPG